jgi:hypothetical protein
MGDLEYGLCDICGNDSIINRKYYYYDIKCDCCNSKNSPHFEIVKHCYNCKPKPPRTITLSYKPMTDDELNVLDRKRKLKKLMKLMG